MVCWQGPPDFESGQATKVRFLPGELIEARDLSLRPSVLTMARAIRGSTQASGKEMNFTADQIRAIDGQMRDAWDVSAPRVVLWQRQP